MDTNIMKFEEQIECSISYGIGNQLRDFVLL